MFDESLEHVALLQGEKLHSVLTEVGLNESNFDAMNREFEETTGLTLKRSEWRAFVKSEKDDFSVVYFAAVGPIRDLVSTTDEPIAVFSVDCVDSNNAISNITWLLPLARLVLQGKSRALIVREV